ncbi:MAG: hypothetical protein UR60_C0028G0017 [Candidatus Moranbacteria bacterium GW2011_GWF2_34_56]|nr:MAG: hypothetical protein UR51_C0002G0155 [Candidatus Moranbacteria bacterium GW2011_GWF1_34_10]KKP64137.1 MAG: hypothetical protein UR60_C0028G0017 [Candidatus Moranbacteria bacterium GW2011_GWF2_34_56]HBI17570.1 hypothetical protein [Candidatus Moranbacteria bacterium]
MSKLIVVCGLQGSGKTTLANCLANKLNIACLHKDSLIDMLSEINNVSNFEEYKKVQSEAMKLFFKLAEEQISSGVDFIIQSTFNFSEDADLFRAWIEKYKLDFCCVVCVIDEKTRSERFKNRPDHFKKYFIDKKIETNSSQSLNKADFDYNEMPEKKIFVKTDHPVECLVEEILEKINF